ncbi:MAG TPA: phosphoribosylanthranilate isomerase [Polyangia bacterium]|jgi:phosphoribosylanthranilate isomerase
MDLLVKICGVTTAKDAAMAAELGADAIGVNFWPGSKRYVDPGDAAPILAAIPKGVLKVGIFVNPRSEEVAQGVDLLGLDRVQLHGDERATDYPDLDPARLIRAVRVRDAASLSSAGTGGWNPGLWLYDAFVEGYGGGGVTAPWALIAGQARRPFLLGGGLTPDNVAEAVRATRPDGVDVASGVERAPGVKDPAKVAAFIAAARAAI